MDDLKLLATRAAGMRAILKQAAPDPDIPQAPGQSGLTTAGNLMGFGGGATALAGFGGKHIVENNVMPQMSATAQGLSSPVATPVSKGLNSVSSRLGLGNWGSKAWQAGFKGLSRPEQAAVLTRLHGKQVGLAGLGVMGAGLLLGHLGKSQDINNLRQHGGTLSDIIRQKREAASGLQQQLGSRTQELEGLRGQLTERDNLIQKLQGQQARAQSTGGGQGARAALQEAASANGGPSAVGAAVGKLPASPGGGDLRMVNLGNLARGAGNSIKGWWDRMRQTYGG